jgi:hypothetical protein
MGIVGETYNPPKYSARKILTFLGVKKQLAKAMHRKIVSIGCDAPKIRASGNSRRGRPVADYLLNEGYAKRLFMVCRDQRYVENKLKVEDLTEDAKRLANMALEFAMVKSMDIKGFRQYYPMRLLYSECKINRNFSTWINDIKRKNKNLMLGSGHGDEDLENFIKNNFDIYVRYEKPKKTRGRPKIKNAFLGVEIAKYEAFRHGVQLNMMMAAEAELCAMNYLKIPKREVNILMGRPEDFTYEVEDEDNEW